MYNEFNLCISDFSHEISSEDYWYDCGILEAAELLNKFDENDWEMLIEQLKHKSILWQKRLVECLGDLHSPYELNVILELINTEDEDLFVTCIDSLRCLDLSKLNQDTKKQLLTSADLLIEKAMLPVKKVLEEFIKKNLIGDN
ncbi:MAG: hypothetical protein ACK5M5_07095 [Limnobaculum xujianqingii]